MGGYISYEEWIGFIQRGGRDAASDKAVNNHASMAGQLIDHCLEADSSRPKTPARIRNVHGDSVQPPPPLPPPAESPVVSPQSLAQNSGEGTPSAVGTHSAGHPGSGSGKAFALRCWAALCGCGGGSTSSDSG